MNTSKGIAVITGADRGLGRASALRLAEEGVDLIITYRGGAEGAAEVVDAAVALGRRAVALRLDLVEIERFDSFAQQVRTALAEHWGRDTFDHLVNNAGNGVFGLFADVTIDDFDALLAVHFRGVFFLTQRLLPMLADGGRIVMMSTALTRFAGEGTSAYSAMKGAVEVLTRCLAKELGSRGIRVNSVAPGPTATDFNDGRMRDDEDYRALLSGQTALGRVGEPTDVGGVVAALLAPETGWITGQRIEVSGGTLL